MKRFPPLRGTCQDAGAEPPVTPNSSTTQAPRTGHGWQVGHGDVLERTGEEARSDQHASCTPTPAACDRCRCRVSGRVGLESFALLDGPDVRSDGREVFGVEVRDGWHVSEVPVVLPDASERSYEEGSVGACGMVEDGRAYKMCAAILRGRRS